ncbi:MAG: sulfur carrier protein ThiS [Rhodocyclaceae bacterium]|nr:sulfur carrier protein ThiS [Rhodocyclaceae bacterium]
MLEISINGAPRQVPAPLTLAALLENEGLLGRRVAVEKNGEIVPKSQHASTLLAAGDRLEIVVAVGGG